MAQPLRLVLEQSPKSSPTLSMRTPRDRWSQTFRDAPRVQTTLDDARRRLEEEKIPVYRDIPLGKGRIQVLSIDPLCEVHEGLSIQGADYETTVRKTAAGLERTMERLRIAHPKRMVRFTKSVQKALT